MKTLFISVLFLFSSVLFAQNKAENEYNLTGILHVDSKIALDDYSIQQAPQFSASMPGKKSPLVAGLLSLVIPGAGEIYTGEYWKAAIFLALEAGLVTAGLVYDKKGDDKTKDYQNFADDYWSVVRYAQWMIDYKSADPTIILTDADPSLPAWKRIDWEKLNAAERLIDGFSHTLPAHGEQQYYEQIGKYFQYSSGWNDYTSGENNALISPNFTFYSNERGLANDYYNTASAAVIGIYINHFLSALDGAWSAIQFNKNLAVKMRVEGQQFARHYKYIPTLHLRYSF